MCMLCVIPPGVIPEREKLENSALNNPHGYGFAIVVRSENRIIRERTMNADESINRFLELRTKYNDGYAMWHARYATHGGETVENCHPFIVGNDEQTYLAHNGILDIYIQKNDDRSDTRVFAEELLPAMGGVTALDNDYIWNLLEDWTTGSKVAVLTVDPAAKHEMYLLNAKSGWEDKDGVWWSNSSCYLDYYSTGRSKSAGLTIGYSSADYAQEYVKAYYENQDFDFWRDAYNEKTKMYTCPNCSDLMEINDIMEADNTCWSCGFCIDCNSVFNDCQCRYTSDAKYARREEVYTNLDKSLDRINDYVNTKELAIPVTGWSNKDFDF